MGASRTRSCDTKANGVDCWFLVPNVRVTKLANSHYVKGELVITSSRRDLEFLPAVYILRADVLRENALRGICYEELLLRYSRM
jgi:hypothetical protein